MARPKVKVVSAVLPLNKGYQSRVALWSRVTKPGYPICGVLTISEYKLPSKRQRERRYCVLELSPDKLLPNGRRFQVSKPLHLLVEDGRYYCFLADKKPEQNDKCTCKGFESGVQCTHLQALRALWGLGHLPAPTTSPPRPLPVALPPAQPSPPKGKGKGKPPAAHRGARGKKAPRSGPYGAV